MAAPPSPASSAQIPSGSTTSAGSSGGATASSKRKRRLHDLSTDEIEEIVSLRGKMAQAVVGKKFGIEQTEVSAIQRMQRVKTARLADESDKKSAIGRLRGVEVTVPIVYGSISFWLGKKAAESLSHRWTTYVRSANNEDLSVLVKKVVFQLHPSFKDPARTIETAPFELTEQGWGEFEIGITLFFHPDVAEKPLELFHHLKLYSDDEAAQQSTKKPVVVEAYDEIVLTEPMEALFARIRNHPAVRVTGSPSPSVVLPAADASVDRKGGDTKEHVLAQWFMKHSDTEELASLAVSRQQIRAAAAKLKKDINALEAEALRVKASVH